MASLIIKQTPQCSIADLFELPLLTIFDHLPLLDLFHIDEVCRAWQELKRAALLRRRQLIITNNNQCSLPLLDSPYHRGLQSAAADSLLRLVKEEEKKEDDKGTTYWPYWQIKVGLDRHVIHLFRGGGGGDGDGDEDDRRLETQKMDRLAELLPNLTVLRVALSRHQLVELTIWFWGWRTSCEPNQTEVQHAFQKMFLSLMTCLNRLTALRSLELNFWAAPGCPVILDDNQMATHCLPDVAGRLKWLKFITCFEFDDSGRCGSGAADARLLKQILFQMRDKNKSGEGDGSKVKQQQPKKQEALELYVNKIPLTLQTLIPLGPGPVAAGLRSVKIDGVFSGNSEAQYKALARFARQSPHLQALTLGLKSLNIHRLVESLAPLKELVNLSIFCYPANSPLSETVNIDGQLPVMPSVKSLELSFSPNSHHDYQQLHLEVLFPNLQTVDWSHLGWGCPNCGYLISQEELLIYETDPQPDGMQFRADYGRQMQRCLRLARLAAFSQLPRLTHLWLNVRPCNVYIPFKSQLFTNCSQSLHRLREFVDQTETTDRDSFLVVYDD